MAFPVVVTADCKSGTGDAASVTADYPGNLAAGDLILFLLGIGGRHTITPPSSPWVSQVRAQGGGGGSVAQQSCCWAKKLSDGTESGGTFSASWTGGTTPFIYYALRITGWYGTLGTTMDNSASAGSVEMAFAEGNSNTPDPPNLDPANWLTEDTLWLATNVRRAATGGLVSYPSGFSLYQVNTTGDPAHDRCGMESAVSSLNPGSFVTGGGDDWMATTIAIRPRAAPAQSTPFIGFINRG